MFSLLHSSKLILAPCFPAAPIDGVTIELSDTETLAKDLGQSKNIGFSAKLRIHPSQIAQVNEGFWPSHDDISWAKGIVKAISDSSGAAVQIDGKMVDKPMLIRAQAILAGIITKIY